MEVDLTRPFLECLRVGVAAAGAAVVVVVLCASHGGRLSPCPEVQKVQAGARLKLAPAITRDLQAAAPGFKPLTMADYSSTVRVDYEFSKVVAPWAVIGDFDGDGFCDLVIDGHNKTDAYRLCAWGTETGPHVVTLSRRRLASSARVRTAALTLVSRDQLAIHLAEEFDQPSGDAFGEEQSGKLMRIYYWRHGHFVQRNMKQEP